MHASSRPKRRYGALLFTSAAICASSASADTGAIHLVDSGHLEYFVNQDITFSTTSSASAAASEASFTASIAATTSGGGTEMTELNDAFDGAMALAVSLTSATTRAGTGDADWTFFNRLGAAHASTTCLSAGAAAPTATTMTGDAFTATGFVGGEQITLTINHVDTVVTFVAGDQTPAAVVAQINTAVGRTVASESAGALVITDAAFATKMSITGAGAAAIGYTNQTPNYVAGALGDAREVLFATQSLGDLRVSRRVFVPEDDAFLRQVSRFENVGTTPLTFTVQVTNNLGSDSNTKIYATSSGDLVADASDQWVGSFQNYSGSTSSDPRLAFVLFNAGSALTASTVNYADGDDNPYWIYTLTLAPGEVKSIVNFVVATGSKASAQAGAEALLDPRTRPAALRCLTPAELATIVNFPAAQCGLAGDTACDDGNADTTDDHCTAINTCAGTPIPMPDGGTPNGDGGTPGDGGTMNGDGGTSTPHSDGGCSCDVAGAGRVDGFNALVAAAALGLATLRRRLRRAA